MSITRFRYAWEPRVYHSADGGAPGGGGNPPAAGAQGGAGAGGDPPGDGKGGEEGKGEGDPPRGEAKFTQADIDRVVAQRLEEEKGREKKRTDKAKLEAAEEAARKNGEWETVATARQTRIGELEAEVDRLKGEIATSKLETVRERVAAKHKLPPQLAARLRGTDEASLDADAKELAKLVAPPKAGDTETGKGHGQGGGGSILDTFIQDRNKVAASAPNPLRAKTA